MLDWFSLNRIGTYLQLVLTTLQTRYLCAQPWFAPELTDYPNFRFNLWAPPTEHIFIFIFNGRNYIYPKILAIYLSRWLYIQLFSFLFFSFPLVVMNGDSVHIQRDYKDVQKGFTSPKF